jgi:hypothetical protein
MEGGIAILLLLILVAVVGGIGFALFSTGFGISLRRDRDPAGSDAERRPVHTAPTSVTQEKTRFVGVHHDDDDQHDRPQ